MAGWRIDDERSGDGLEAATMYVSYVIISIFVIIIFMIVSYCYCYYYYYYYD